MPRWACLGSQCPSTCPHPPPPHPWLWAAVRPRAPPRPGACLGPAALTATAVAAVAAAGVCAPAARRCPPGLAQRPVHGPGSRPQPSPQCSGCGPSKAGISRPCSSCRGAAGMCWCVCVYDFVCVRFCVCVYVCVYVCVCVRVCVFARERALRRTSITIVLIVFVYARVVPMVASAPCAVRYGAWGYSVGRACVVPR